MGWNLIAKDTYVGNKKIIWGTCQLKCVEEDLGNHR